MADRHSYKNTPEPEGAGLLVEVFNSMTDEQKSALPEDLISRLVKFITNNGYRLVFGRWYLQQRPSIYRN